MNVEQWIDMVKDLLDKARPADKGLHCLIVADGQLQLVKKSQLKKNQWPLVSFTSVDVNLGLTSSRWYNVGCKLAAQKELNPGLQSNNGDSKPKT